MKVYKNTIIWILSVLFLLALVITPTTLFNHMLKNDIALFQREIDTINDALLVGDREATETHCDLLEADWQHHRRHWSFYVHHNTVDTLDQLFSAYLSYSRCAVTEEALAESGRLSALLRAAEENDRLTFVNIF